MDDVAAPDMEFETDDDLCADIRNELDRFFDELGLERIRFWTEEVREWQK